MRWVRYSTRDQEQTYYGILEGDQIVEVIGNPFQDYEATKKTHALGTVKIEVPVIPPTFYCVGLNYADHITESAARRGIPPVFPEQPDVGYRAVNALIAHDETVIIPTDSQQIQYEGELVVVIGKKARNLSEKEALSCVLGYTIGNDVSEREWQKTDRTLWRAKNSDTFKPMGPWIETDIELDELETRVSVNGTEEARFPTNNMIFGIETYISTISKYITLIPGDVLWMGTDGMPSNLKSGDIVEIEITGIGILRNKFRKE